MFKCVKYCGIKPPSIYWLGTTTGQSHLGHFFHLESSLALPLVSTLNGHYYLLHHSDLPYTTHPIACSYLSECLLLSYLWLWLGLSLCISVTCVSVSSQSATVCCFQTQLPALIDYLTPEIQQVVAPSVSALCSLFYNS